MSAYLFTDNKYSVGTILRGADIESISEYSRRVKMPENGSCAVWCQYRKGTKRKPLPSHLIPLRTWR